MKKDYSLTIKLHPKTRNLLNQLGGIEGAIEYLKKYGNFSKFQGVGRAIDFQLQDYLYTAQYGFNRFNQNTVSENESLYQEIINLYEYIKKTLGVRTYNILFTLEYSYDYEISFLDKVFYLHEIFLQPFDFFSLRNAGEKTVSELYQLREVLKAYVDQPEKRSILVKTYKLGESDEAQEEAYIDELDYLFNLIKTYRNYKKNCSIRTLNILESLEKMDSFGESHEFSFEFMKKYFLEDFNYYNLRKSGVKTVHELEQIKLAILSIINHEAIPEDENTKSIKTICRTLGLNFTPECFSSNFLEDPGGFSIEIQLMVLLNNKPDTLYGKFIREFYFTKSENTYFSLAKQLGCSAERLRQMNVKTERSALQKYRPLIEAKIQTEALEKPIIIEIEDIVSTGKHTIRIDNRIYSPNEKILKILYQAMYYDTHIEIDRLLLELKYKTKSFDFQDNLILLNRKSVTEYNIGDFIKWIDAEIYNFEVVEFEYDINVLVNRYFIESNIIIPSNLSGKFAFTLSKYIKKEWPERRMHLKRESKKQKIDQICEICSNLISRESNPLKTQDILMELETQEIEIGKQDLLNILNSKGNMFVRLGNGLWQLKDKIDNSLLKGSLRQMVSNLIIQNGEPMHVSEILMEIGKYRPINEHSLLTNLRADESAEFVYFNCSFIGLKGHTYSNEWSKIPRFNAQHLNNKILEVAKLYDSENIGHYYQMKYGYPTIHIKYLLERREQKRNN